MAFDAEVTAPASAPEDAPLDPPHPAAMQAIATPPIDRAHGPWFMG
jgi:hypothetical protein